MSVLFANRFKTTLSAGVSAAATTLPLSSVGALPAIGGGDYCYLTLTSADQATIEVVKATARAANNVTVVRAQEGTAAVAWAQGVAIELRLTTQSLLDALAERLGVAATAAAAVKLATPRTIDITGDVAYSVSFDGSVNVSAAGTIQPKVVTNAKLADMTLAGVKGALAAGVVVDLGVTDIRTLLSISSVENKSSATIRGELTSGNVTSALGFTPAVSGHNHDAVYSLLGHTHSYLPLAGGTVGAIYVTSADQSASRIGVANTGVDGHAFLLVAGRPNWSQDGFTIYDATAGADRLRILNDGAVSIPGSLSMGGTLTGPIIRSVQAGGGYAQLLYGDGGVTGYLEFCQANGARAGYCGFASAASGAISVYADAGYHYNFNTTPKVNGTTVSLTGHTHAWADIVSGKPTTLAGYGITDAATSGHVHSIANITNLQATLDQKLWYTDHTWGNLLNKPVLTDFTGGFPLTTGTQRWNAIPTVAADGVMEVGAIIDFHTASNSGDFDYRITASGGSLSTSGPLNVTGQIYTSANIYAMTDIQAVGNIYAGTFVFTKNLALDRGDGTTAIYLNNALTKQLYFDGTTLQSTGVGNFNFRTANVYTKDLTVTRGDGTGALYLNEAQTRYLYWDNANYNMPGATLILNGRNVLSDIDAKFAKAGGTITGDVIIARAASAARGGSLSLQNGYDVSGTEVTLDLTPNTSNGYVRSAQVAGVNEGGNGTGLSLRTNANGNIPVERVRIASSNGAATFYGSITTNDNFVCNATSYIRGSGPTQWWQDNDNRTFGIHVNSGVAYFMRGATNDPNWSTLANGQWPMTLNLSDGTLITGGDIDAKARILWNGGTNGAISHDSVLVDYWAGQAHRWRTNAGTVLAQMGTDNGEGYLSVGGKRVVRLADTSRTGGNVTISTAAPSGGVSGDIWLKV